mmetsp:Transcript_27207/g.56676  ORF Transcript_27207/g.56676 Transcript_27207/m.56676 type:complete len:264 (+) Transcript_27207:126-917(+)
MASNSLAITKAMVFITTAVHLIGRHRGAHAFRVASSRLPFITPQSAQHLKSSIGIGQTTHSINTSRTTSSISQYSYRSIFMRLRQEQTGDNDNGEFEPTWTYTPYKPPPKRKPTTTRRRNFSTSQWIVPDRIPIPEDRLTISFARASGAGGQNVNKVNTKVELRFHLPTATWIPQEVRDRLKSNESNRISQDGYMAISSQEHRTQLNNRKEALKKLEDILRNSWARPKVRRMRKGLSKRGKENRREMKKKISLKKEGRRKVDF